jgi:hypothetical protein
MLNLQLRLQNPKALLQASCFSSSLSRLAANWIIIPRNSTLHVLNNVLGHLLQRWEVMVNPACSCKLVDLGSELDSECRLKSPGFEA